MKSPKERLEGRVQKVLNAIHDMSDTPYRPSEVEMEQIEHAIEDALVQAYEALQCDPLPFTLED